MADLYGFSQQSAQRIASAVKKVESMAGDSQQSPYQPETTGSESFVERHIGKFTGVWAKGQTIDVTLTADNQEEYTEEAKNYFEDVGKDGVESECLILQVKDEWVLVSAEPQPFFLIGTFDGEWAKGAYKTVWTSSYGEVNVYNLFALVNEDGASGVTCAIAWDRLWYLVQAECV
jgi:hypothetical protein